MSPPPAPMLPRLAWTRRVAILFAVAGLVVPAMVVFDLFTNHGCDNDVPSHPLQAVILAALALLIAYGAMPVHRRAARWVARRVMVRSKLGAALAGALILLPGTLLGVANAALAGVFYFTFGFYFCMSLNWFH